MTDWYPGITEKHYDIALQKAIKAALSAPPVQQRVWDEFGRTNSGDETGGAVQRFGFDISRSKPEIIPATCGAFVYFDDYLALHKKLAAQAAPEPSAQPVAGAVATDETGWLIEHSGEILPGAEQRAQVSWLRVQMKFNGYGAREFGFTHDANEALRFARKEDAEAVLAMHLGASPPDWYSKPFSVTEHMWPLVPQAQAAPEPEPSAQYKEVGFFIRYSGRYPTGDFVGEIQAKYGLNEGDKLYKVIK